MMKWTLICGDMRTIDAIRADAGFYLLAYELVGGLCVSITVVHLAWY